MPSVDPAKPGQMMRASHFAFPGAVLNAQVHVVSPSPGESSWLSICAHQCLQRLDVFASGVHTESWPKGRVWSCERMRHWGAQTLSASPVEESIGQEGPYWHSAVPPWGKGDASKPQLFLLPSSLHAISDIFTPTTVCWTSLLDYQTSTRALLSMGDCQNQVLVVGRKQWLLSCDVWLFVTTPPPELQHTRLPCLSLPPRVCSNSWPLSQWCYLIISSFAAPFFCLQSFPASWSFSMSWLFASGGQSNGASASARVLPVNIQGWFPSALSGENNRKLSFPHVMIPFFCSPKDTQPTDALLRTIVIS